ncbi:transcriptional regulator [Salinigranum rubrum]|uniref:Transcriptional regulator n=1 Tax=Salinigranum rubrum TaxID=755307 RepID=A0A2I8VKJ7_9EURY|nr:helix-turn-helix domain-containing protein [Salinigranum rubrum]AUV82441.1 transcriptional regulator [Salinigranum rubrum]
MESCTPCGGSSSLQNQNSSTTCSLVHTFDQIGSKWQWIVVDTLLEGEKRFNELKRSTNASSHTLSRVLGDLEENDLVQRRVDADGAVSVHYALTEKGRSLSSMFDEIDSWAGNWLNL